MTENWGDRLRLLAAPSEQANCDMNLHTHVESSSCACWLILRKDLHDFVSTTFSIFCLFAWTMSWLLAKSCALCAIAVSAGLQFQLGTIKWPSGWLCFSCDASGSGYWNLFATPRWHFKAFSNEVPSVLALLLNVMWWHSQVLYSYTFRLKFADLLER